MRPKFYVDSSGTTWASETVELRYLLPDEFEISTGNDINTAKGSSMRQACARIHDSVFQFYDMSEMSDVMKATEGNMEHVAYEIQRIDHLCWQLQEAIDEFDISYSVTQEEKDKMESLNVLLLLDEARAVSLLIGKKQSEALWNSYMILLVKCKEMMNSLRNFDLPAVNLLYATFQTLDRELE